MAKSLPFIDVGKSCSSREFLTSQICLLPLFTKVKFSGKFLNLQYYTFKNELKIEFNNSGCPLIREKSGKIWIFFKVREKSGNIVKWSEGN